MRTVLEICEENRNKGLKFMDMFELKNDKPGYHGPLVHKETGESYQSFGARSEYEYEQLKKES